LYCSEHKLEGMIDFKHKLCIHPGCKTIPTNKTIEVIQFFYNI